MFLYSSRAQETASQRMASHFVRTMRSRGVAYLSKVDAGGGASPKLLDWTNAIIALEPSVIVLISAWRNISSYSNIQFYFALILIFIN